MIGNWGRMRQEFAFELLKIHDHVGNVKEGISVGNSDDFPNTKEKMQMRMVRR